MKRIVVLFCIMLNITSCGSFYSLLGMNDPIYVVRRKYEAMSRQDQSAYLRTVIPETRSSISTMNTIANGLTTAFIHLDPFDMNLGGWMDLIAELNVEYQDMKYEILEQKDDYALVKASGNMSVAGVANFPYCMYQDVRKVDDQWYNDEYSEHKQPRMKLLIAKKMELMRTLSHSSGSDASAGGISFTALLDPQLWAVLFDFC